MNNMKACSNCGGTDHYLVNVNASGESGGNLPVGALHGPRYENIICGTCGLTQWFVAKEHLYLVREKLPPVK